MKIKIVIADDHKIIRDGLCSLIEKHPNMQVIAEVENGKEAVEVSNKLNPDVVILDISMPDLNGIEATRKITAENPNVKVIGLTMHSDSEYVKGMLNAGASGYLLKDCAFGELIQAINSVTRNKSYLSPEIASIVIDEFKGHDNIQNPPDSSDLTGREREILQLIAEGNTSKEIAAYFNLSVKTVATHRQNIMDKTHCHDVVTLTKYAIRKGFTSPEH
jgi:two-component system, NarL family, response regulator NreC